MNIGYARTSTLEQAAGFDAQLRDLEAVGCEKVYREQVSSVGERDELARAMDYLREGDTLVVTKLDRLARSTRHLGELVETLEAKGAHLRVLDLGIDTNSATGQLVLNILGSIAQFERSMMLERQREGIARAKTEGKYRGRQRSIDTSEVQRLRAEGLGATAIAKRLGIGRASVYRALSAA